MDFEIKLLIELYAKRIVSSTHLCTQDCLCKTLRGHPAIAAAITRLEKSHNKQLTDGFADLHQELELERVAELKLDNHDRRKRLARLGALCRGEPVR